jgi:hypothetical protein
MNLVSIKSSSLVHIKLLLAIGAFSFSSQLIAQTKCELGNCVDGIGRLSNQEKGHFWVSEFKNKRFQGRNVIFFGDSFDTACYSIHGEAGRNGLQICKRRRRWGFQEFDEGKSDGLFAVDLNFDGTINSLSGTELPAALVDWDDLIDKVDEMNSSNWVMDFEAYMPARMRDRIDFGDARRVLSQAKTMARIKFKGGGKASDYQREAFIETTARKNEARLAKQGSLKSKKFSIKNKQISQKEREEAISRAEKRLKNQDIDITEAADWMLEECELLGHVRASRGFESCLAELIEFEEN